MPAAPSCTGAALDLVPLARSRWPAVPAMHVTATTSGGVTAALAAGGHYELRFRDPAAAERHWS